MDWITINDTPNLTSNWKALGYLGLPYNKKAIFRNEGVVTRWRYVNKITEISVHPDFILIQVNSTY